MKPEIKKKKKQKENWKFHKYMEIKQHTLNQWVKEEIKRILENNLRQMALKTQHIETQGMQ